MNYTHAEAQVHQYIYILQCMYITDKFVHYLKNHWFYNNYCFSLWVTFWLGV